MLPSPLQLAEEMGGCSIELGGIDAGHVALSTA